MRPSALVVFFLLFFVVLTLYTYRRA